MKTLVATPTNKSLVKSNFQVSQLLHMAQWLSMDVVLGAMCSAALVCQLLNIQPFPWSSIVILGMVVWIIYTVDHLYDARRIPGVPVTGRHWFHRRYQRELQVFTGALIITTGLSSLILLPVPLILFGIVLGSLVLLYLWLVNTLDSGQGRKWFHKELCVGIVYTAGIWGVGFLLAAHITWIDWLLAFAFALMVWQNLVLFSWYEVTEDIKQQQRSVVQSWGQHITRTIIAGLFGVFAVDIGLILYLSDYPLVHQAVLVFVGMSAALGLLFLFPQVFRRNDRYRWIGDGVFLVPGLLFLNQLLFS